MFVCKEETAGGKGSTLLLLFFFSTSPMGDDETLPCGPDGIPSITKKSFWRLGGVVSWFCQMPRLLTDDCKMSFSVLDCRLYTCRACFPQMFGFGMRNVFSFTPRF